MTRTRGDRKARRRYRKVKADRQRRRYTLQAAHELADELARAGGQDTPRVEFARQEVDRIRQAAPPTV